MANSSIFSDILGEIDQALFDFEGTFENILHNYASYNYIWTLSVMDHQMVNFPSETYKKGRLGRVILKSGSGDPTNRVQLGDFGAYDFMIDDVSINSIIGFDKTTGNTNATKISFKVFEPYSMGMFFHALQIAAKDFGYNNYICAPYLLTLEFVGHKNPTDIGIHGDSLHPIEKTTRHIPMKFLLIELDVNEAGATYNVEAIPWNETAAGNTHAQIKDDITISGSTVHELLQDGPNSLEAVLNRKLIKDAEQFNKDPDEIIIIFPKDPKTDSANEKKAPPGTDASKGANSATIDPSTQSGGNQKYMTLLQELKVENKLIDDNKLTILVQKVEDINAFGAANMNFSEYKGKSTPFAEDNFVYDADNHIYTRGQMSLKPDKGEMKFPQTATVMNIINEVILMSEYGQNVLKKEEVEKNKGNIMWWKIDFQSYISPSEHNTFSSGEPPLIQVYRVIPYMINASVFLPPDKSAPEEHVTETKKQAIKEYNYIYTGKNLDIISFELHFKMSLYQAMFDVKNTADQKLKHNQASVGEAPKQQGQQSTATEEPSSIFYKLFDIDSLSRDASNMVRRLRIDALGTSNISKGGALSDSEETKLVKQAQDVILNGADMLTPTIKILGDPYYLGDSGWGNYTAQETKRKNINADHSINYQNGEVDIIVNFRTPLDIKPATGTYEFGDPKLVSQFSGVFKVLQCESTFSKGKFLQELKLSRRMGQDPETGTLRGLSATTSK